MHKKFSRLVYEVVYRSPKALNTLRSPPPSGDTVFHAVTKNEIGDSRFLNFVSMDEELFVQRQVEERNGFVFMRAKKRAV